jgi:hypothetical protein
VNQGSFTGFSRNFWSARHGAPSGVALGAFSCVLRFVKG